MSSPSPASPEYGHAAVAQKAHDAAGLHKEGSVVISPEQNANTRLVFRCVGSCAIDPRCKSCSLGAISRCIHQQCETKHKDASQTLRLVPDMANDRNRADQNHRGPNGKERRHQHRRQRPRPRQAALLLARFGPSEPAKRESKLRLESLQEELFRNAALFSELPSAAWAIGRRCGGDVGTLVAAPTACPSSP